MINSNLITDFFYGKVKLWKSFWLVGFGHSLSLFFFVPIFEKIILKNTEIYSFIEINQEFFQFPDFSKLSLLSKLIVILSTLYVTVGIWRSSEKYEGSFFWIVLTFFYLSFNNILPSIYLTLSLFF